MKKTKKHTDHGCAPFCVWRQVGARLTRVPIDSLVRRAPGPRPRVGAHPAGLWLGCVCVCLRWGHHGSCN